MSKGTCLVIEDDEDIAGLISLILTREGFDVRSVRTASAALHQLRGLTPALITLNLGLPDLDGLQIAKDLRALSTTVDDHRTRLSQRPVRRHGRRRFRVPHQAVPPR